MTALLEHVSLGQRYRVPFESDYSVVKRFLVANRIPSVNILVNRLNANHGQVLEKPARESAIALIMNTAFTNKAYIPRTTKNTYWNAPDKRRYCPMCAEKLYHTHLFNFPWVSHCPIHNIPLQKNACGTPSCYQGCHLCDWKNLNLYKTLIKPVVVSNRTLNEIGLMLRVIQQVKRRYIIKYEYPKRYASGYPHHYLMDDDFPRVASRLLDITLPKWVKSQVKTSGKKSIISITNYEAKKSNYDEYKNYFLIQQQVSKSIYSTMKRYFGNCPRQQPGDHRATKHHERLNKNLCPACTTYRSWEHITKYPYARGKVLKPKLPTSLFSGLDETFIRTFDALKQDSIMNILKDDLDLYERLTKWLLVNSFKKIHQHYWEKYNKLLAGKNPYADNSHITNPLHHEEMNNAGFWLFNLNADELQVVVSRKVNLHKEQKLWRSNKGQYLCHAGRTSTGAFEDYEIVQEKDVANQQLITSLYKAWPLTQKVNYKTIINIDDFNQPMNLWHKHHNYRS